LPGLDRTPAPVRKDTLNPTPPITHYAE